MVAIRYNPLAKNSEISRNFASILKSDLVPLVMPYLEVNLFYILSEAVKYTVKCRHFLTFLCKIINFKNFDFKVTFKMSRYGKLKMILHIYQNMSF